MHPHATLIESFYRAFGARDGDAMVRCYHRDVQFSDPVFVGLDGTNARAMWRMLAARAKDLRVEYSGIDADDTRGRAHWDAHYTFSQTGRTVLNRVDASFEFRDGLIVRHTDVFDLRRWSRQALGPVGALLGWSPMLQRKIRGNARAGLAAYLEKHPEAGQP